MGKKKLRLISKLFLLLTLLIMPICALALKTLDFEQIVRDFQSKKTSNLVNYTLYKSEEIPNRENKEYTPASVPFSYRLVQKVNISQTLMDINGNTWWNRDLVDYPDTYYRYDEAKVGHILTQLNKDPGHEGIFPGHISSNGTLAILTDDQSRWQLIDRTGKQILLPQKSNALSCRGFSNNKYWLFTEQTYENSDDDYIDFSEYDCPLDQLFYSRGHGYENENNYFTQGNGYCLFKDDGTLYLQYELPDSLALEDLFFSPDMNKVVYNYRNKQTNSHGFIYAESQGKIITKFTFPDTQNAICTFPEEGDIIILQVSKVYLLNQKTGKLLYSFPNSLFAVSSDKTGYLAYIVTVSAPSELSYLVIYDFNKGKPVFCKEITEGYNPGSVSITKEGSDVSLSLLKYGAVVFRQYYHLEQQRGK
jgi:outer membrane protein assembly factor BamB